MSDLRELIAACLDDEMTSAEREELTTLLKAHPDNLRAFVDANLFEQHLRTAVAGQARREAAEEWAESGGVRIRQATDADGPGMKPWLPLRWPRLVAVGAAALLLIAAGISVWIAHPPVQDRELARITRIRSAQVSMPVDSLHAGQTLPPGRLTLVAGAMELVLSNGVEIVFEGPGELELLTPMRAILHAGQAVVRVPVNARGFLMETPGASLVDLGTEFGLKAGPGLNTDVQVYRGEVIATPKSANAAGSFGHRLLAGDAARFTPDQGAVPQSLAYSPDRFVRRLPADPPIEHEAGEARLFNPTYVGEIVVRTPRLPIVIDGDLSEWSEEGAFRGAREFSSEKGYSFEGRMRFDADFLYIAAHIGDPFPLRNIIDPATDGELAWRGGGLQVRVSTDRKAGWPVNANAPFYYKSRGLTPDAGQLAESTNERLAHLTLWRYAPSSQNCLHIAYGMDFHGPSVNPAGYRAAFRRDADGLGYTLEYAIPWSLLHAEDDPPRAGDILATSWTVHWSDASGRLWRGQLVELRNPAEPQRIHTWERAATWGKAVFQ